MKHVVATFSMLAVVVCATAGMARAEWPMCTGLSALMEKADSANRPIAILYMERGSSSSWWQSKAAVFENTKDLQTMVCVRIYADQEDAAFDQLHRNTEQWFPPQLMIIDGKGRMIGYCNDDSGLTSRDIAAQARQAWTVYKWEKQAQQDLDSVDKKLDQRRYPEVEAILDRVEDQDKKASLSLKKSVPWRPERESGAERELKDRLRASGKDDEEFKKKMAEKAREREARNAQWFFYEEIPAAREKLKAAITKEIADAKERIQSGNPKEAMVIWRLIQRYKSDEDLAKQITELKTQIDSAIAEQKSGGGGDDASGGADPGRTEASAAGN